MQCLILTRWRNGQLNFPCPLRLPPPCFLLAFLQYRQRCSLSEGSNTAKLPGSYGGPYLHRGDGAGLFGIPRKSGGVWREFCLTKHSRPANVLGTCRWESSRTKQSCATKLRGVYRSISANVPSRDAVPCHQAMGGESVGIPSNKAKLCRQARRSTLVARMMGMECQALILARPLRRLNRVTAVS